MDDTTSHHLPIQIDWETERGTSRTVLTTHLWSAPPLRRESPIHDRAFAAFRDLKADYARFLPFWTHPRLSVAQLERPTEESTNWDFSLLDPIVEDFMAASEGRPVVGNFATIPAWMFDTPEPVTYGDDPDEDNWAYETGHRLHDESTVEIAEYFHRVASWYIAGGFTDERGRRHESGHRHRFDYWEVLCEPDVGHQLSPQTYTRLYDEVVKRVRRLDPDMRFIGLSLAMMELNPEYLWYFLDPANHEDGIPLDAFSYHFYACPDVVNPMGSEGNPPFEEWRGAIFGQVEAFLDKVKLIESLKNRLSPDTKTFINEVGTFAPDVMNPKPDIPADYWALSGAAISYLWSRLLEQGIELVGIAEFIGYAGMIPGTSLLDWETGEPNARYHCAKLLIDNFGVGDRFFDATVGDGMAPDQAVHARGFITADGRRKLLLVNKFDTSTTVILPSATATATVSMVDTTTGARPPIPTPVGSELTLGAYATAVVTLD
ncbi:hypothetical protein FB566_4478 [Stackebrandtia endophytica]|uniref:D-apionate lactonase C-terminal domain-containing protein n=1 Tax=Stackebrandtia endophytica TaxID=1496996 RepID=A0A543B230_9ACTN|nr:hypothetical protein [Stackebrandtia endophytica]TQL78881.1 hypothetical protein FB566_4478 [Stackebrandtia endophytica]